MFPWLKEILHKTPTFVPTRWSHPHFCSSAHPCPLFPVNNACTVQSCHLYCSSIMTKWLNNDQVWWETQPTSAFLLCAFGSTKISCFLFHSYLMVASNHLLHLTFYITWHGPQFPFTDVRASNNLLKSPVVWSDWRLKPYETNTFLAVLSMHSKWAQIGRKFNPDSETSANVPVNLIQPSGLFHPVSGFIVKVSLCPTCCPNKPCLKQNKDISKNEALIRQQCFSFIPYVRTCTDKQYVYSYCSCKSKIVHGNGLLLYYNFCQETIFKKCGWKTSVP